MKQIYALRLIGWCMILTSVLKMSIADLYAQSGDVQVKKDFHNQSLLSFIQEVEQTHPVTFYFVQSWIDSISVIQHQVPISLNQVLTTSLENTGVSFYIAPSNQIYLTRNYSIQTEPETFSSNQVPVAQNRPTEDRVFYPEVTTKPKTIVTEKAPPKIIEIGKLTSPARQSATIVGYVKDHSNGEPQVGATVLVDKLKIGITTDQYGYYSLTLPTGPHRIVFRSYGNEEIQQEIILYDDGVLDMEMEPTIIQLDEVMIEAERDANIESSQMGLTKLSIEALKQMPSFMGEIDVIKSALLLPGIQSLGEGASGFNVRGGSADQNLVLLNQAPIFNPTHLFGFFSVFNPDIIQSFDLYKSGVPARYGGRISSVLDISMKDGNKREIVGSGGISPVTARFALEGPIKQNKSSFIVSGRTSYSDWILGRLPDPELRNSRAGFFDVNGKINMDLGDKDRIDFSAYMSRDNFKLNGDTTYTYYNINGSFNWKHLFNNKLYAVSSAVFSQYNYQISSDSVSERAFDINYRIKYHELKTDFTYVPQPDHLIRFGLSSIFYQLNPGSAFPQRSVSFIQPVDLEDEQASENSIYISDEWEVGQRLKLYGGFRYSFYMLLGPNSIYQYRDGQSLTPENIIDSTQFRSGKVVQSYGGPEIRFSARYALDEKSSIKLSYNRLRQYLHMLSNTTSIAPSDTWKLSDPFIRPQIGDQFSLGYYRNFRQNSIEFSMELYVKKIKDMLEFKNGAQLLLNPHVETDIINGEGKAYGVEFLIKKDRGKLNGWISYTYSRVFSQVNGPFPDEVINLGKAFPANSDKPHDFSFVGNYKFSRRFSISSNFAYSTGRPITYPVSQFSFGNGIRLNYSLRNQYRVPDYYRWDLSFNFEGNHSNKKFAHTSWSLSFFNLLGRRNVYSIYFVSGADQIQGYKLSIFGRPITTLTFNFKI